MFILQLLKIIFIAAILVLVFRFAMHLVGIGRAAGRGRARDERRRDIRNEGPQAGTKKGVIELDKDQYKVE